MAKKNSKKKKKAKKDTGGGRLTLSDKAVLRGKKLGNKIQQARLATGDAQEDLAVKAGIRLNTLKSIETGRTSAPSIFMIVDLAKALNVKDITQWLT